MVIGQVVFSTSPQEHYFDCPYQLSSEAVGQTFMDATVLNPIHHMNFSQHDSLNIGGKRVKPILVIRCFC